MERKKLAGENAHAPGGAASFEALVGFLLFFGGHDSLTGIAALPDAGTGDKFSAAAAALLGHGLLKRENPRLLGQEMRVMEVAMRHIRPLSELWRYRSADLNWVVCPTG